MITVEAINKIMDDVMLTEEEAIEVRADLNSIPANPDKYVVAEGIVHKFVFMKDRLEAHRSEVVDIINQLPNEFRKSGGGGWSFLNLCTDKDGNQWGEQHDAEALYVIANGLGLAKTQMPKTMWGMFPGGVPYIVFE
jgi:hypothetical protein